METSGAFHEQLPMSVISLVPPNEQALYCRTECRHFGAQAIATSNGKMGGDAPACPHLLITNTNNFNVATFKRPPSERPARQNLDCPVVETDSMPQEASHGDNVNISGADRLVLGQRGQTMHVCNCWFQRRTDHQELLMTWFSGVHRR